MILLLVVPEPELTSIYAKTKQDCGVYVCFYGELILLGREFAPNSFNTDDRSMLEYRKKMCYRIITIPSLFQLVRPRSSTRRTNSSPYIVHDSDSDHHASDDDD